MISPSMNSMTSVEKKNHSRTPWDCTYWDMGLLLGQNSIQGVVKPSMTHHKQQSNSGGYAWTRHKILAQINVPYWISTQAKIRKASESLLFKRHRKQSKVFQCGVGTCQQLILPHYHQVIHSENSLFFIKTKDFVRVDSRQSNSQGSQHEQQRTPIFCFPKQARLLIPKSLQISWREIKRLYHSLWQITTEEQVAQLLYFMLALVIFIAAI